ncbi:MAG: prepilin-type N-terminal cleavage/methylation domain-containing protein [Opitutaceae bacterium]|jgi:general secretion pathway protein G|nr:prepilin-type N-terminal cleavage/methylation domain-containing protein [Opitutaceae bacterium]
MKRTPHAAAAAAAFTLVELLAVIAIIGILAAILIPVISKVRQSARMSASLSNIRQIGQALLVYVNDNRQYFPWLATSNGGSVIWSETLEIHMGWPRPRRMANGPYNDPDNRPFNQSPLFMDPLVPRDLHHFYGDYGANELVMVRATSGTTLETLTGPRVSLTSLSPPARVIAVVAAEVAPVPAPAPCPATWRRDSSQRATGGKSARASRRETTKYLAAFADGHARWLSPEEFDTASKRNLLFNKP